MNLDFIHFGDCMQWLATLPDGCADMVLTDPPYGTMHAAWDVRPDVPALFAELWRVLKRNGALCVFAQLPFAAELVTAGGKFFRYEWVWVKNRPTSFLDARRKPMRKHELVLVFYREPPTYNAVPIPAQSGENYNGCTRELPRDAGRNYNAVPAKDYTPRDCTDGTRFPQDVVTYSVPLNRVHGTQKPQDLCEMLISQYTRHGELVLDPYAGSGTTPAAALATGRHFAACEWNAAFHKHAVERMRHVCRPLPGLQQKGLTEK